MNVHNNARLTPKGREDMVRTVLEGRLTNAAAARNFNTTPKTVAKWLDRFKAQGVVGLRDRSSKPLSSPSQISLATADAVEALRRQRRTQEHIAGELGISKATVSRVLQRRGLSLLSAIEPQPPRPRYEREKPGEIIHIDIKKLGRFNAIGHRITGDRRSQSNNRGVGWEFAHIAIDDHSRVATAAIFPDERKKSAVAFLRSAVAYFKSLGVTVDRVMTDTEAATNPSPSPKPASGSASNTSAPNPTRPRPTARPSALSKLPCANGPMPQPSTTQSSGARHSRHGCTATIGIGRMLASARTRPSADSA